MLAPNRTFRPTRPRPTARTLQRTLQGLFAEPLQSSLPGKASPVCPRLRIIQDPIARLNPDLPACASHADRPAAQVHAAQAGKLLIFTEHRDTLESLAKRLEDKGYTVATIHGGMDVDARKQAQREFRTRAKIMVATDAAGEGINLQFCRYLINWDGITHAHFLTLLHRLQLNARYEEAAR